MTEGVELDGSEGHRALGSDLSVERRRAAFTTELAFEEAGQILAVASMMELRGLRGLTHG